MRAPTKFVSVAVVSAISATCLLSGCVAIAAAAVAAGVVHATSDDSSEVTFERTWHQVFSASVAEIDAQGRVDVKDQQAGRVKGHVNSAEVVIMLQKPTENTVLVRVTARTLGGLSPAPDVAEGLALGLVKRLGY